MGTTTCRKTLVCMPLFLELRNTYFLMFLSNSIFQALLLIPLIVCSFTFLPAFRLAGLRSPCACTTVREPSTWCWKNSTPLLQKGRPRSLYGALHVLVGHRTPTTACRRTRQIWACLSCLGETGTCNELRSIDTDPRARIAASRPQAQCPCSMPGLAQPQGTAKLQPEWTAHFDQELHCIAPWPPAQTFSVPPARNGVFHRTEAPTRCVARRRAYVHSGSCRHAASSPRP